MLPFRTTSSKALSSIVVGKYPDFETRLSVFGNISASNVVYGSGSNSNNWGSSFTTLCAISGWKSSDLTTDQVGAIPPNTSISLGTDAITILEDMLYSYKSPLFLNFDINLPANNLLDLGETINNGTYAATWSYGTLGNNNWSANSIGIALETQGLVGSISYNTTTTNVYHPNNYSYSIPTDLTFYLSGGQTVGANIISSDVYSWRHRIWYGRSALESLASYSDFSSFSNIKTQGKESFDEYNYSFPATDNTPRYLYILTPSSPGNFASSNYNYSKFKDFNSDLIWPFNPPTSLGPIACLNSVNITYNVYRSVNATAGSVTIATFR